MENQNQSFDFYTQSGESEPLFIEKAIDEVLTPQYLASVDAEIIRRDTFKPVFTETIFRYISGFKGFEVPFQEVAKAINVTDALYRKLLELKPLTDQSLM